MPVPKRTVADPDLSDFLLRACHDLRGPARVIRTHAELFLRDPEPPADFRERLGFLVDGARKIDRLVDALAGYSLALRIEPSEWRPISMSTLLRSALARLRDDLQAGGGQVTNGELPRVSGDPDRLMELWEHLLRNSIQHRGPAPPRIRIEAARAEAGAWTFAVRDNGPGVEAADLDRIFRPFEHGPGQRTGPGMGLAICRAIVERHGGTIWAESAAGAGAAFFFTLPAVEQS